jgi:hypothetical protein
MLLQENFCTSGSRIYPDGFDITNVDEAKRHREAARLYALGWLAALIALRKNVTGDAAQIIDDNYEEAANEIRLKMADPNWWPDAQWQWWSTVT